MEPITCTLTTKQAGIQALDWHTLGKRSLESTRLPDGVAITFPAEDHQAVTELADLESACCSFLDIDVRRDGVTTLTITSANPDARPVIDTLAALISDG